VGTDSNVEITATGELRMLEYSQRLTRQARNVCSRDGSTAGRLFRDALLGGAQALGAPAPGLAVGAPADLVALRDAHGFDMADDRLLDRWVFGRDLAVSEVWVAGRHVVTGGRHVHRDRIGAAYRRAMAPLLH
jgi:cytosine/adenosine deaminase-related metal-dependent hydrolase